MNKFGIKALSLFTGLLLALLVPVMSVQAAERVNEKAAVTDINKFINDYNKMMVNKNFTPTNQSCDNSIQGVPIAAAIIAFQRAVSSGILQQIGIRIQVSIHASERAIQRGVSASTTIKVLIWGDKAIATKTGARVIYCSKEKVAIVIDKNINKIITIMDKANFKECWDPINWSW